MFVCRLVQANSKENNNAPHYLFFVWGIQISPVDSLSNGTSNAERLSMSWQYIYALQKCNYHLQQTCITSMMVFERHHMSKLDESTAGRHLKSPQSLSGRSLHLTLVTKWSRSHLTLKIQMSRSWPRSNPLVTFEAWSSIDTFAFNFLAIRPL